MCLTHAFLHVFFWLRFHVFPYDQHDLCVQCLAHAHAEEVLMDGSCPTCSGSSPKDPE